MTDRIERTIEAARQSFNKELLSVDYPRIHGDDDQVGRLVAFLDPRPGGTYLDLATGNGAVAFAVAGHQPEARIIGVDIADRAIARNQTSALEQAYANVEFLQTNGREIDFPAATFDGIACRYALHHFPDVEAILADARRVLRPEGSFVIADAIRHPKDDQDFINLFQALKPDGHVRIYTADDLVHLFRTHGFEVAEHFGSAIAFTRDLNPEYRRLIDETPRRISDLYGLCVADDRVALRFDVLNVKFVISAD
jgi:ubiquinone/menaquinone biosynthesis C-methylase UbiE